jgi:hypothetical protein
MKTLFFVMRGRVLFLFSDNIIQGFIAFYLLCINETKYLL